LLRHDDHHSLSSDSGGGVASLLTAPVVLFGFMIHQQKLLKLPVLLRRDSARPSPPLQKKYHLLLIIPPIRLAARRQPKRCPMPVREQQRGPRTDTEASYVAPSCCCGWDGAGAQAADFSDIECGQEGLACYPSGSVSMGPTGCLAWWWVRGRSLRLLLFSALGHNSLSNGTNERTSCSEPFRPADFPLAVGRPLSVVSFRAG
jgi:hypothetical protein